MACAKEARGLLCVAVVLVSTFIAGVPASHAQYGYSIQQISQSAQRICYSRVSIWPARLQPFP